MVIRALSEDLQRAACEQLNEQPENIAAELQAFRSWILQQPQLKARTDDQLLLAFLRGCKHNLDKAKSKLEKYYQLRTAYPKMFKCTDINDAEVRTFLGAGLFFPLPMPLHDNGPRILFARFGTVAADKFSVEVLTRSYSLLQQIQMLEDDYANVHGYIVIYDGKGCTAAHMWQYTPSLLSKMMAYSEKALPVRQRAVYAINVLKPIELLVNFIKKFVPQKQKERIHLFSTKLDNFYNLVPKKYMPKEYGGENGSIPEIIEQVNADLDKYSDYFQDEVNYGTIESQRPQKSSYFKQLLGFQRTAEELKED